MKKFLFVLSVLCLLCMGTALAAGRPCDQCGGSTVLASSGSWCHWYCEKCDYTTSRSHDPHSSASGLSPDSCSGHCRWCGASANYSSHTFTKYVSNNNPTCVKNATETATCDNGGCGATRTQEIPNSALGHDYVTTPDVEPTCTTDGRNKLTCARCAHVIYQDVNQLGHFYGQWTHNGNGTHSARCRRDCGHSQTADCPLAENVIGGKTITYCPVCGYSRTEGGEADLQPAQTVSAKTTDGSRMPGRLTVLIDPAPVTMDGGVKAFYLFTTTLQSGGTQQQSDVVLEITIDLNPHPFHFDEGFYVGRKVRDLTDAEAKLVRVVTEVIDGIETERWVSVPFSISAGKLTFKTQVMGVYMLVPRTAKAPNE